MRRKILAIIGAAGLALAGCALVQPASTGALVSAGVPVAQAQTITADAATVGQLMCKANDTWIAITGANVVNATSKAVANLCALAAPGAVPGAPPTGTLATVVAVTDAALAALNASKPAS